MSKLKKVSGRECVQILCKHFGFEKARQRGSHIILRKTVSGGSVGTVVPDHKELKLGTLKGVLKLAKIPEEDFAKYQ